MISDPLFPRLISLLRQRGWIEKDGALHPLYGSIWVDLSGIWPNSVEEFRQMICDRMDRLRQSYAGNLEDCQRETLADTADLLEALETVTK